MCYTLDRIERGNLRYLQISFFLSTCISVGSIQLTRSASMSSGLVEMMRRRMRPIFWKERKLCKVIEPGKRGQVALEWVLRRTPSVRELEVVEKRRIVVQYGQVQGQPERVRRALSSLTIMLSLSTLVIQRVLSYGSIRLSLLSKPAFLHPRVATKQCFY